MASPAPSKTVKDVPVANDRLYKEVAAELKVSPAQVEECIKAVGKFIADTVRLGAFETIMVPYFGKFKVKTKNVQWRIHRKVMPQIPTHIQPKNPNDDI